MPKRKSTACDNLDDFQSWWNKRFFRSDLPYYRTYKALYDVGADLDYIHFLQDRLEGGDFLHEVVREQIKEAKKTRRRKRKSDQYSEGFSRIRESVRQFVPVYLKGFLQSAMARDPSDPILDPRHPGFDERLKQVYDKAIESGYKWHVEKLQKGNEEENKSLPSLARKVGLFMEYIPSPESYKKGGRTDRRGSFFLGAVTKHIHKKRGRYLLAMRLLKAIRGQRFESAYRDRTAAKARVRGLEKYSSDWKSHVRALRKTYLSLRTSPAS